MCFCNRFYILCAIDLSLSAVRVMNNGLAYLMTETMGFVGAAHATTLLRVLPVCACVCVCVCVCVCSWSRCGLRVQPRCRAHVR